MSVLVLDDREELAQSLGTFLSEQGFDVSVATSITEAEGKLSEISRHQVPVE
jgi:DNA-binding response OmpR family regulator